MNVRTLNILFLSSKVTMLFSNILLCASRAYSGIKLLEGCPINSSRRNRVSLKVAVLHPTIFPTDPFSADTRRSGSSWS